MSLLSPAALGLAALALPILLLYMLKLRRKEVQVSSTFLWQMLLRDRQANAPWQRLKRNLLLFLQLLILALLVLALSRPAIAVPSIASGSLVVVLDASASMNAVESSPGGRQITRFQIAQEAIEELISGLQPNARMTLILAGRQPQVIAAGESDSDALRQALAGVEPGGGNSDWAAAFALAAGAAAAEDQATTVLVSDGGLADDDLPVLPGELRFLQVGKSQDNLAVGALAVRASGGDGAELFTRVYNYGSGQRQAILSLYADGALFEARQLEIPAGQSQDVIVTGLSGEASRYEARLSPAGQQNDSLDALPNDDAAFAVFSHLTQKQVLLAPRSLEPETRYNQFLQQVLQGLVGPENITLLQPEADGTLKIPPQAYDLYVFDGILPAEMPDGNLLLINPPSNPLFQVGQVFTQTTQARVFTHALTTFVDWSPVHVLQARQVALPAWGELLVQAPGGALVFAGQTGGRRMATLTFDLHDSDLPLQIAYPILFSNLVDYLLQAQPVRVLSESGLLQPDDPVTIQPEAGLERLEVVSPAGEIFRYELDGGELLFNQTAESGFYTLRYPETETTGPQTFAVNLFSPQESEIRPASSLQTGGGELRPAQEARLGLREFWPYLAAAALVLLLLEWWIYQRGAQLPRLPDWMNYKK